MCSINESVFDKVFSFLVDEGKCLIELNDEVKAFLNFHCGANYKKKCIDELSVFLPSYFKRLISFGDEVDKLGLVVRIVKLDNGFLSVYCHALHIDGKRYKYVIGVFYPYSSRNGMAYNRDIIDSQTGFYNKLALDVLSYGNGSVLIIFLYDEYFKGRRLNDDLIIKEFSFVLKGLFGEHDAIFRFDDNWFAIMRGEEGADFHKEILKIKKVVYSSLRDKYPSIWFSYKVERITQSDLIKTINRGVHDMKSESIWR